MTAIITIPGAILLFIIAMLILAWCESVKKDETK